VSVLTFFLFFSVIVILTILPRQDVISSLKIMVGTASAALVVGASAAAASAAAAAGVAVVPRARVSALLEDVTEVPEERLRLGDGEGDDGEEKREKREPHGEYTKMLKMLVAVPKTNDGWHCQF
jgi:hypothetical protein